MKFSFVRLSLLMLPVMVFTACHKSDNMVNSNQPVSALMAFNLATDKAVDITLSGNPINNLPVSFASFTGNYVTIYSGNRLAQSFDYNSRDELDSTTYLFEPQKYYSLFVMGTNGKYRNVIVKDNFDSLPAGKAFVRYVNAIPDSSLSNVTITAGGTNVANGQASFGNVSPFTAVSPGAISIQVNNGGTINKSRTIAVDEQKAYTILLAGIPGSTGNDSLQIRFVQNGTVAQNGQ